MQLVIEALINVLHSCVTQIYIYIFIQRQIEEIQKYFCGANKFSQQDTDVFFLSIFFLPVALLRCFFPHLFISFLGFFFDPSKNTMAS